MSPLIPPYGPRGLCVSLPADEARFVQRRQEAIGLVSWTLTPRQLCDVELLLSGGFSPLDGFMNEVDYQRVVHEMRLVEGTLWPMPIVLDVDPDYASQVSPGMRIALRDSEGVAIAILRVTDRWTPDKRLEAECVYGCDDRAHPGVEYLYHQAGSVYLGGPLHGIELPSHYDYRHHRHTPAELRAVFHHRGWRRVVAFQTHHPMHRAHHELTARAAQGVAAHLLIQPIVGAAKPGALDHYARVRCYEHLLRHVPEQTTQLSLLPLATRMAGPREVLWRALIGRNYGCTHLMVGREPADPGIEHRGAPFYRPGSAQALLVQHQPELGIEMVPVQTMMYVAGRAEYLPADQVPPGETAWSLSDTELHRRLREDLDIPDWFTYPEIAAELRRIFPARHRQGFTVFFTGLSGAGKSTLAHALRIRLMELGGRAVTLLDGDIVRTHLSSELGFSRAHRDLNVRRIGFVASEITKNGGIALCAPIAPYAAARREARALVEAHGGFVEVYVATPLPTCEARDRKGLYARARAGQLRGFTGVNDPYEAPESPELCLDTSQITPEEALQQLLLRLEALGFIR